ncbi:hypothetical protein C3729_07555 [Cloacibacterium normanense]|uniref:Uncharacterized protein n=1 Tax=Cloacibacterium normanense TaxID=237258 RepID=A0A2S7I5R8_9FLAO|nr:hypothetical protein C3729_07555 [Cloacibacterium normanense]
MFFWLEPKEPKIQVWKSSAKNVYPFLKTLKLTRQNAELKQQTFFNEKAIHFLNAFGFLGRQIQLDL